MIFKYFMKSVNLKEVVIRGIVLTLDSGNRWKKSCGPGTRE